MCLVKVRQEEDVVVPYRVVRNRTPSPVRRRSVRRVSRVSQSEVFSHRESPRPSASYVAVPAPAPAPLAIPPPQPVPVFVAPSPPPAPAPPPPRSHVSAHYVEVSPRSDYTSSSSSSPSRSEYITHEREYRRERNYSPESSPRYEHFRYVDAAPEPDRYERYHRERSRSRARSRGRSRDYGYDYDPRGSYRERETRERITISDGDGRRTREYRR
ncbi:hypothetical protein BS50DRAFT_579088 [Corynespora cassiicola Philippines]|uniref:Uncharacterized protein n=1 Tax=Corynespora cassiicola Philippines TaxID=1448308 RepID=A0A2T2N561_CORCC|nr:hypothetical protein BS50DRAFT_579088 [Corynespora cassiicola Philippines]